MGPISEADGFLKAVGAGRERGLNRPGERSVEICCEANDQGLSRCGKGAGKKSIAEAKVIRRPRSPDAVGEGPGRTNRGDGVPFCGRMRTDQGLPGREKAVIRKRLWEKKKKT